LPKNSAKKLAFLNQNKAKVSKILTITLVFEKNAIFAENCQKSQKIVIITSTPETALLWISSSEMASCEIFRFKFQRLQVVNFSNCRLIYL
jgi:fructoselysine-6-P-deglycase FrlB-like protein